MSYYAVRWTFELSGGAADSQVRFSDGGGMPVTSDQLMPANEYITKGETGSGNPQDFCDRFEAMASAAHHAIYGAGPGKIVCITRASDGVVWLSNGGTAGQPLDICWTHGNTTLDPEICGWDGSVDVTIPGNDHLYGDFVPKCCWYPMDYHVIDERFDADPVAFQVQLANGQTQHVTHGDRKAGRFLEWDRIAAARMRQVWADNATAAANAGVEQYDPSSAFVHLFRYTVDGSGPNPGQVYLYTTMNRGTHEQHGPYYTLHSEADLKAGGVSVGSLRRDMRQRVYRKRLGLIEV